MSVWKRLTFADTQADGLKCSDVSRLVSGLRASEAEFAHLRLRYYAERRTCPWRYGSFANFVGQRHQFD